MHLDPNEAKTGDNHVDLLSTNACWSFADYSNCNVLAIIQSKSIQDDPYVVKKHLYQYLIEIEGNKHMLGLVYNNIRNFKLQYG